MVEIGDGIPTNIPFVVFPNGKVAETVVAAFRDNTELSGGDLTVVGIILRPVNVDFLVIRCCGCNL